MPIEGANVHRKQYRKYDNAKPVELFVLAQAVTYHYSEIGEYPMLFLEEERVRSVGSCQVTNEHTAKTD